MNKDYVYVFDKLSFIRRNFGEIQTDFNICLTIDGTKDSTTIIVFNYESDEIEPNTILFHDKTHTWWIVSHDKVERLANEVGYLYKHTLDLLGAIELLNARDLTDCGFNDNTYTKGEFINRLFSLSTFEYNWVYDSSVSSHSLRQKVGFIKTFENYTLYSALREFLDAYNSCAKLTFTQTTIHGITRIENAVLHILYKTGNPSFPICDIDDFKDVKGIKNIDKDSFGTCVVSNANNVISTQAKTYPATGLLGFSGKEYDITFKNAVLRLPSNVYKVNWLKMISPTVIIHLSFRTIDTDKSVELKLPYENDNYSISKLRAAIESFRPIFINHNREEWYNEWVDTVEDIWKRAKECYTVTFYANCEYNPNNTFSKPDSVPYFPTFYPRAGQGDPLKVILCPKEVKENMKKPEQGIAWERGSNLISGFEILEYNKWVNANQTDGYYLLTRYGGSGGTYVYLTTHHYVEHPDLDYESASIIAFEHINNVNGREFVEFDIGDNEYKTTFVINYVPMADLKIKVDNNRDKKDIKLYNQTGKLSDSYALSKLLNSYSKEISGANEVRYGQYYSYDDVPKVGSLVNSPNGTYVINNISMDIFQNESSQDDEFGYFIDCEFNLCKYSSTKSLMVSPNTNIRDYAIPQNYNVKRKQLYRDYYELSYDVFSDANQETPYIPLNNVLHFIEQYKPNDEYFAYIKTTFENEVEGSYDWYYQLDCSAIFLQKQMMIVCDFLDNNIIGYCQNNRAFIFDVSNLFNQNSLHNTPISYVDEKGKVKDFEIMFINQQYRGTIDETYYTSQGMSTFPSFDALTTQVFIPEDLYNIAKNNNYFQFKLDLINYKKDALEVPVFEYSCQVDDSEDVLIGDNILQQYENCIYFYCVDFGEYLNQNTSYDGRALEIVVEEPEPGVFVQYLVQETAVVIEYRNSNSEIEISFFNEIKYDEGSGEFIYGTPVNVSSLVGKDFAIYRKAHNNGVVADDLLFICKKVPASALSQDGTKLTLKINHYKLN